jgi:mono/diheme cytochrome c family protein
MFKDVEAIFSTNCVNCHSGDRARGGIDLTTYDNVLRGGDKGLIVKKGAPKHSLIIQALRGATGVRHMPPERDPLSEDQISLIESWIKAGAKP